MSLFDRLNNPLPDDDTGQDADRGREPRFVPGHLGARQFSIAALLEKIITQFTSEYSGTPALREADSGAKRLKLLRDTAQYVLSIESVELSADDKITLLRQAYSELFGYGPLDALLLDTQITTIALEGVDKAAVRFGHGDLVMLPPLFEDTTHMQRVIARLVADANAELREDQPYLEVGLIVGERPVCISLVTPPIAPHITADIRLHPPQLPSTDDLLASGFMNTPALDFLRALAGSTFGCIIAGDTESGKTTLLGVLAQLLPAPETIIAVERARELHLTPMTQRLFVRWPVGENAGISFGAQISQALAQQPACLLLDEVRADEPHSIAALLSAADAPRQIWSFRGTIEPKRLQNALAMLARRADSAHAEDMVRALYQRLPFVLTVRRHDGKLHLHSIAEWQFNASDYPTYTLLLKQQAGLLTPTGTPPEHALSLPPAFWSPVS